jgi:hypothetical protein
LGIAINHSFFSLPTYTAFINQYLFLEESEQNKNLAQIEEMIALYTNEVPKIETQDKKERH